MSRTVRAMSDGFAYLDILFFAAVAAFIAFRLRSVLGRKTGNERHRPSPIGATRRSDRPVDTVPRADAPVPAPAGDDALVSDTADPALKAGLTQIRLADPEFDLPNFLEGAQAAFAMIVEAFAKGDKAGLRPLLADDVFESFKVAIDERERAGHVLVTDLVSVKAAELAGATMDGTVARVTVRFTTEQVNVTRDAQGDLVDGDPSATAEVVDLWTFARDTRSRDPNWLLVETRTPDEA